MARVPMSTPTAYRSPGGSPMRYGRTDPAHFRTCSALLHSPPVCEGWLRLGTALGYETALDPAGASW